MALIKIVFNQSGPTEFVFQAFTSVPEFQVLLFLLFLLLYLMILCGNMAIITVVCTHSSLLIPMYFFLCNLSLLEICYTTVVVPLMLANILGAQKPIPLAGCGAQMFFFITFGSTDCFLLAVMAYDRYVAICHPLHYTLIMTQRLCVQMVTGALGLALFLSLQLTTLIFTVPFCRARGIQHFFCDVPPVMRLVCTNSHIHENSVLVAATLAVLFFFIAASYIFIVNAVLKINSASSHHRVFSTCSSHLLVVLLQYGCCAFMYLRPNSNYNPQARSVISLVYILGTPLLNPLIYTLRNNEMKGTLGKILTRNYIPQNS
ncbi:LOW QUALITY PROTEIN: olfactory receptor 10Q1-like [Suncus etruscus]|uniref:LOW QUALITY PROTEIN: olfactory receptor 10Q1-like n=1 Tax=Suncus etruscus TaxID=109475 RepID=UPI0021109817|nr:LOW QUALITY PROTEIN: olfactory receptor 10Q1-like [Suncus etruscus]